MLLLGYDMRAVGGRTHYASYEERVDTKPPFALFLKCFPTLAPALAERRIEVLNCTPGSALSVWPHVALEEALLRVAA
jgi:hypothetical protein